MSTEPDRGWKSMESTHASPNSDATEALGPPSTPAFKQRYELLAEVGRGGMGVVYRARHRALDRQVAIKIMLPEASGERFLREAQILARISSPFVVAIHDFDVLANGCPMLVMEWVEGTDLRKIIKGKSGPLDEDRVLKWMRHTCEGMLVADRQGIIHRDLKPSNLLVDAQGVVRVADFGLARGPITAGDLSQSHLVMGTPHYMAPEQAEDAHAVDTRADVYSFGATFYHALTGRPPFEAETNFMILFKHKTEPLISPRYLRPDLSARTVELLERCLAKSPGERFTSFADVLKQLHSRADAPLAWAASEDADLAAYMDRYRARRAAYLGGGLPWNTELDVFTFPRGQTIRIVRSDIVKHHVDAVVSSDNCHLQMSWGVSAAIRAAAGPAVAQEAARTAPVRPGRVLVTSGGKLPARLIFHAVTVGVVQEQLVRPSRDLIAELMASCFYHADSHDVKSIAFPLLGTGAQRFDRDVCLDVMFHFLVRMFLRGLTTVTDARIVLYHDQR